MYRQHSRGEGQALRTATAILLVVATGAAGAGELVTVDGRLHVRNGAEPSAGTETMRLKEQWRVGGEDGDVIFGLVSKTLVDENGDLYVLDYQLSHIEVFGPDGGHLRTLSREGEGPGEARQPIDLVFTPEGDLGIVQAFPGKLIRIDRRGQPVATVSFGAADPSQGNVIALSEVIPQGGQYFMTGTEIIPFATGQTRQSFLAAFTPDGAEKVRFYERRVEFNAANLEIIEKDQYAVSRRNWAVGPDGLVYMAPYRDEYKVEVFRPDGALERIIERSFTPTQRTPAELAMVESAMEATVARIPVEVKTEVSKTNPVVTFLWVDGEGSLWVQHSASHLDQPEGVMLTYDVFDPEGHFTRRVSVEGSSGGDGDLLRFFEGGRAILISGLQGANLAMQGITAGDEEAEPLAVVSYAVER